MCDMTLEAPDWLFTRFEINDFYGGPSVSGKDPGFRLPRFITPSLQLLAHVEACYYHEPTSVRSSF